MNTLDGLLTAFQSLRTNKLRSALTMLGIVIGVSAVVVMTAIGAGAEKSVQDTISRIGANLIMVMSGNRTRGGVSLGSGQGKMLTLDDVAVLFESVPEAEIVTASSPSINQQIVYQNRNWPGRIEGVDMGYLEARGWNIEIGRGFTLDEFRRGTKLALLGSDIAKELYGAENPLGTSIRIGRVPFTVVGVLKAKGQSGWGGNQDETVIVPLEAARQRLIGAERLGKDGVGMLWIKLYESGKTMVAEEKIREILRARHRLKPGEDDDFAIRNIAEMLEAAETSSRIFTLMLASIAAVSLIVGGIGIMNIMLVSVTERTREIGLRMALGARRRDIRFQFLIESLLLCVLGGMIGIAIGIGGAFTISRIVDWALVVSPLSIVLAFTFSAGVGLVFGWLPARRAARLDPVESLRYE